MPVPKGHRYGGKPKGHKAKSTLAKEAAEAEGLAEIAVTAKRVIQEMARVALVDMRGFWTVDGKLKNISELTPEQGAALAGFEAIIKNAQAGDGQQDLVHKIKLWDKPRALEMLAKHFGLLTERLDISGTVSVVDVLRQRFAKRKKSE